MRAQVETYFGKPVEAWKPMVPWKYSDWMGWHEQGDGKLFLGVNVEQGRVKNEGDMQLKTMLRVIADKYQLPMVRERLLKTKLKGETTNMWTKAR